MLLVQILDEVHNATGDAPMAAVLQMYRQWREQRGEGAAAPQVLGFTASPACKRTLVRTIALRRHRSRCLF